MKYKFILAIGIIFLSGCSLTPTKTTPAPTLTETPVTSTLTSAFTMDSFKEKYDFEFTPPNGWKFKLPESFFPPYQEGIMLVNKSNPSQDFIKIVVEPLSSAPVTTKGIEQGEAIILTKQEILEFKKQISKEGKMIDNIPVLSSIDYDVPGGSFYQYAKFFYKENLVTIYYSLNEPVEYTRWGDDAKKKISDTLEKIRKGEMTEASKKQKEVFEGVVNSLKFH